MRYVPAILCAFGLVSAVARAEEATPAEGADRDDPKPPSLRWSSAFHEGRSAPTPPPAVAAPVAAPAPSLFAAAPARTAEAPAVTRWEPAVAGPDRKVEAARPPVEEVRLGLALFRRGGEAPITARHAAPGSLFASDDGEITQGRRSTLSPDLIQGAVRPHMGEVRFCFQKAQQHNPSLEGRVFVRFTVTPDGQVATSDVESSTIDHPAVEKCLTSAVRRWTFPKPSGGGTATVSWPFKLVALQ